MPEGKLSRAICSVSMFNVNQIHNIRIIKQVKKRHHHSPVNQDIWHVWYGHYMVYDMLIVWCMIWMIRDQRCAVSNRIVSKKRYGPVSKKNDTWKKKIKEKISALWTVSSIVFFDTGLYRFFDTIRFDTAHLCSLLSLPGIPDRILGLDL